MVRVLGLRNGYKSRKWQMQAFRWLSDDEPYFDDEAYINQATEKHLVLGVADKKNLGFRKTPICFIGFKNDVYCVYRLYDESGGVIFSEVFRK